MSRAILLLVALMLAPIVVDPAGAQTAVERAEVEMWLPAVGQRSNGSLFGVASSLTVTMQTPGSGQVFLSSQPLTQLDMQGSARLAVTTAASVSGVTASDKDFFFSVRTSAVTVGGPSAGGAMATAVLALLKGWTVHDDVIMTGMIDPDGSIGPIGGILQKAEAADSVDASTFLIPLGQGVQTVENAQTGQTQSVDVSQYARDNFGIEVIEIADLFDAVEHFTDHRLIRPEPSLDPLQHAAYAQITKSLGANLTETAEARLVALESRHAAQTTIGTGDRQVVDEQLELARGRLVSARNAQNESHQYLAASLAFQAHVALAYADAIVSYHEGGTADASGFLEAYLAETDRRIVAVGGALTITYPILASRLDAQAAAEQRQLEALELEDAARQARDQGRLLSSLQSSSFARERAESARWWYKIGIDVANASAGPQVTKDALEALTAQYADTARLQLEYTALITPDDPAFQAAQAAFDDAQAALDLGRDAAALFEMVDVFAQTSTALVSVAGDGPVRQRLDALEDAAAYQIELAQSEGALPVYAISLLELAQSRTTSDPVGAYAGFSAARISARTSLQAAGIQAAPPRDEAVPSQAWSGLLGSWAVVGYLVGSSIVVLVLAGWILRQRPEPPPQRPAAREPPRTPPSPVIVPPPPAPTLLLPAPPPQPTPAAHEAPAGEKARPAKRSVSRKPSASKPRTPRTRKRTDKPGAGKA